MRHILADLAAVQPDFYRRHHKRIKLLLTDVLGFDLRHHFVCECDRNGRHATLPSPSILEPAADTQRRMIRR
jgi:hypothetical protein